MSTKGQLSYIEGGGVTSAKGFVGAGVHAGFRRNPHRLDMGLVVAERPCPCAGTFTQNVFASAPVKVSREVVGRGRARCVIVNSGNANAATGAQGLAAATRTQDIVAGEFGCAADDVLVCSTGVVGIQLSLAPFETGVPMARERLSAFGGHDVASAIMTTDTFPKECAVHYESAAEGLEGTGITVGGCVKGSGMIMPNMATMICVITTDAPLAHEPLQHALTAAVNASFNKVVVDGDTSPNDTCVLLASGAAAPDATIVEGSAAWDEFCRALGAVCEGLARQIATDGEGATKLVTVNVRGARDDADAEVAARAVATSPLVKTAIFGHDCNWGRVAVKLGMSGAAFAEEDVSIDIMGIPVCRDGMQVDFDENEALRRFEEKEIVIDCDLGAGEGACTIWTCDLSYDYVRINGEYRT